MQLVVPLGSTVTAVLDGHSAVDGANFPDGSKLAVSSNDPAMATVPADGGGIPPGGASSEVSFPVTVVGPGSTDLQATVTDPQGNPFTDTATLIVSPPIPPGLTHVVLTLTSP